MRLLHVRFHKPNVKELTCPRHSEHAHPVSVQLPKPSRSCVNHKKRHNVTAFQQLTPAFPVDCNDSRVALGRISTPKLQDVVCSGQTAVSSLLPHFPTHPQHRHAQTSAPQHIQREGNSPDGPWRWFCPSAIGYPD